MNTLTANLFKETAKLATDHLPVTMTVAKKEYFLIRHTGSWEEEVAFLKLLDSKHILDCFEADRFECRRRELGDGRTDLVWMRD
jgi:hypothetical protein